MWKDCLAYVYNAYMLRWKIAQWTELRWWKNYLGNKSVPQYLAWKTNYWNNLLNQLGIDIKRTDTILDLGCGPAGTFIALPQNNHITAVDPLLDEYENNLPHFKKANYPNVTFACCTIEVFIPKKKYDVVFCMNAINHVHDIDKAYNVLCESVQAAGTLIVSIDAHNYGFFKYLFRLIPGDVLHPHQYSLNEYEEFLTTRSMKIIKRELIKKEVFFSHWVLVATPNS